MARQRSTSTEEIVAAAAAVFETNGYRNTTIDDICEAAGVSRPTVYKYIESKPWLLEQMVIAVTAELSERLRDVHGGSGSPGEKLRGLVQLHIEQATSKRVYYAAVMSEMSELPTRARRMYREWSREVTHDFAALIVEYRDTAGIEHTTDAGILANLLLTMLTSLYRWYDPDGSTTPEDLTRHILVVLSGPLPGVDQP